MPVTAESVVIEVTARLDKAKADIKGMDATVGASAASMQAAAKRLEDHLDRLAANSTSSFGKVARGASTAANDVDRATARMANGQRNFARQLADIGAQAAGGQSPFLIFAQQAPQVADALADTGGKAARVASFFAGPWGAALLAAGSVLATLIPGLISAGNAADDMGKAQIDLANYVDLTTGAINRQTTAVQRLAAAQARQATIEDNTREYVVARGGAINAVREAGGQRQPTFVAGVQVPNAAATDPVRQRLRDLAAEAVRTRQPLNDFALAVRQAVGDRPEYRSLVKTLTTGTAKAIGYAQSVERLKAEQALLTGTATAQQKALLGIGLATSSIIDKQVALATATTAVEKARARLALVQDRGRSIQAGDGDALKKYRTDLTSAQQAVNAAEASEKAATQTKRDNAKAAREAAKAAREQAKEAREQARAERELLSLRSDLASTKGDLTGDPRLQDSFSRDRINLDRAGRTNELQERRQRGDLTAAEFTERKKLVDEIADNRLALVNRMASIREANDAAERARATLEQQQEVLSAQSELATTTRERRAIELKLLDLQLEEQRLRAQNVIDLVAQGKASPQEAALARSTLDGLPVLRELGQRRIDRQNEGSAAQYRREIYGDLNEKVEDIETAGLRALEDSLLRSTKAALGLSGALGDVVGELLRIGIQRRVIGPLADALFGKAGDATAGSSGSSGKLGGLLTSIASAFGGGRATGGPVSAGKTYLVGERGPELLRMQGAGTVVPNHHLAAVNPAAISMSAANVRASSPARSLVVVQPIHADFRGARTDEQTMRQFMNYADASSRQAVATAVKVAGEQVPAVLQRYQRFRA